MYTMENYWILTRDPLTAATGQKDEKLDWITARANVAYSNQIPDYNFYDKLRATIQGDQCNYERAADQQNKYPK